jgi:mannosyltransferase
MSHSVQTRIVPIMVALIMVGFFLRINGIAQIPLRGDEAFSVLYWGELPLQQSLTEIATIEPHPVLTYALFRGWQIVAGNTELAMRLLPLLGGLLGIPAIFAIGKRLGGWQLGITAALLFTLHPYEIWHAQDARNYALWAGSSLIALWLGLRALDQNRPLAWLLYAGAAVLAANLFYNELFTVAAFGGYVLLCKRERLIPWLIAILPAIITAVGSFILLQGRLVGSGAYAGTTATQFDPARVLTWFTPTLLFGLPLDHILAVWTGIGGLLVLGIGLWQYAQANRAGAILLASLGLIPLCLLLIVSLRLNIFDPRYIFSTVPAYILIVSGAVTSLWKHPTGWMRGLGIAVLVAWLGVTLLSLDVHFRQTLPNKAPNWPALMHLMEPQLSTDDLVIQLSVDAAFGYYYRGSAPDIALPATPQQPTGEIEQLLMEAANNHTGIWLVGQTFPDWPNYGVVEGWLSSQWQRVQIGGVERLQFQFYKPWIVTTDEVDETTSIAFEGVAELMDSRILTRSPIDDHLTIWVYWRATSQTERDLKVFLHLQGPLNPASNTPIWSQDDQFIQDGRISTASWEVGSLYRDVYELPLTHVPAGTYRLVIGLYDPDTNERVRTGETDSVMIGEITVP